eukprot:scaffold2945_cov99-Cylindrotheca_fusiformis.AAC.2
MEEIGYSYRLIRRTGTKKTKEDKEKNKMFLISSGRNMLPMMLLVFLLWVSLASARKKKANDDNDTDRFNYRQTIGTDYGPSDWNQVNCKTVGNCLGWPDGWELGVGWELGPYNQCQWCPANNDNDNNIDCGLHRQSPIDLLRTTAQTGHDTECYDYHWMAYQDGSCQWHNMVRNGYTTPETSFRIRRHALQILTPIDNDTGRLQCGRDDQFPRLDYSKGFPDWWFLSHTEITTPSEHFQNGKRYDAEDDACCDPERSSTDHCHYVYKFFGNAMEQVCLQCCDPPKEEEVSSPPPPTHPIYPPIDCTMYCCSEPKEVDPSLITILDSTIPSFLPTRSPSERPSNTDQPTAKPTDTPTFIPSLSSRPTSTPTKKPSMIPSFHPTSLPTTIPSKNNPTVPPTVTFMPTSRTTTIEPFQCDKYDGMDGIEIHRICKTDGCCDPIRSSTNQCHYVYKFFGEDDMARLCSDCCNNKELAPPPAPHPTYPPIDCTLVSNPFRICKPTSCCNEERSDTWYCKDIYETYGDAMGSICWYCCSQPKEVDPTVLNRRRRRRLVSTTTTTTTSSSSSSSPQQDDIMELSVADVNDKGGGGGVLLPQGLRANEIRLDPVSFEAIADEKQQQQHITEEMKDYYSTSSRKSHNHHQQESNSTLRNLQNDVPSGNNYVNVRYSPYEWLREVKTEYYFRYEGGQMVPPCYETVHYRVMKDPIRIHSIQLEEIERLLAWRIAPKGSGENECQRDTAGRERPGSKNGNAVDLNRPLQAYSNIHRKVFCECNDWDSKWKEDQEWCKLDKKTRFFDRPYNFL